MDLPYRVFRPFLGARILKTGVAVFIALGAFHWVSPSYGTFAAVAAVVAVQPAVARAKQVFVEQFIANLMAGAVGVIIGLWLGKSAFAMAGAVVIVLGLCTQFRLTDAAGLAVVAVLFIMDRPPEELLLYTVARIATIAGGMLIGTLVNQLIRPPNVLGRLRHGLECAAEGVDSFGSHLIISLEFPDRYQKQVIKSEAASILRHLDNSRYFLDLYLESQHADPMRSPLEKATLSLFVFTQRIMDIHKICLQAGGLPEGPVHDDVANALRAVLRYKKTVVHAVVHCVTSDTGKASVYSAALGKLAEQVDRCIMDPEQREMGLALHGILTCIRHMGWRMESLNRLLDEVA
jgi:hypothetical protein